MSDKGLPLQNRIEVGDILLNPYGHLYRFDSKEGSYWFGTNLSTSRSFRIYLPDPSWLEVVGWSRVTIQ